MTRVLGYFLVWLAIIAGYTGFGFLEGQGPVHSLDRVEQLVAFAAMGVGSASNIIAGLIVIARLRAGRLGKGIAVAMFLTFGVASIIIPLLILRAVAAATPGDTSGARPALFQGEHGLWAFAVAQYQMWAAVAVLMAFAVWALPVPKPKPNDPVRFPPPPPV
jgi:hypothetical protein